MDLFGSTRDEWIQTDLEGWLAPNRFYKGVVDAARAAVEDPEQEVYIVTTKQQRFTSQVRAMCVRKCSLTGQRARLISCMVVSRS